MHQSIARAAVGAEKDIDGKYLIQRNTAKITKKQQIWKKFKKSGKSGEINEKQLLLSDGKMVADSVINRPHHWRVPVHL